MDDPLAPGEARRKTKILPTAELLEDIIVDILLRLPVKSLVRFRCVCKSWYSLLTSSDFSAKHLQYSHRQFYLIKVEEDESMEPTRPGFQDTESDTESCWNGLPVYKFALAADDDLHQLVRIDHPNLQISSMCDGHIEDLQVIGSIDGVVSISLNSGTYIMMWNPATRQSYQLPGPDFPHSSSVIGLGRYRNNGYKVVKVVSYHAAYSWTMEAEVYDPNYRTLEAEVYDSYSNMWHKTDDPPNLSFSTNGCIIANGMPYWWSRCHSIIWFDPIHDTFGTMKLPVGLFELNLYDGNRFAGLGLIRGAVAVLLVKHNDDNDDMFLGEMTLDVWMMDQPHCDKPISWTKQFQVKSEAVPGVYMWLTCWKDGELVFETGEVYDDDREMCLYDRFSGESKKVPGLGSGLRGPDEIFLYKESLISPHPSC